MRLYGGRFATVIVLVVIMSGQLGCEKSAPPEPSPPTTDGLQSPDGHQDQRAAPQPASETVEKTHQSGALNQIAADFEKDSSWAIEAFLQVDWSKGDEVFAGTNLSMSEADFVRQTAAERQRVSEQNLKELATVRELARAVTAAGQKAADEGDRAQAERCFRGVHALGETLSAPDRMALVQLVGKALKELAQKKLDALPAK